MQQPNLPSKSEPGRLGSTELAEVAPGASEPRGLSPRIKLAVCLVALAACWLFALPRAARMPAVRGMVERNERLGIDPSAKFYSELPAMPEIRRQMEAVQVDRHNAFWRPGNWAN